MGRRELITRTSAAAVSGAAVLGAAEGTRAAAADRRGASGGRPRSRPNILLIYTDDLGYGDFSCYGSTGIRTPRIDRLAREGVRFTDAYAGAVVCTPSRAALLTGRVGPRAGLPRVLFPEDENGLSDDERIIPEYLKSAGYATTCIGKWHLGAKPEHNPTRHGFDHFFGALYSNDMTPFELWRDEEVVESVVDQSTLTRRYTEEAVAAMDRSGDQPFFIYVAESMPHIPLHVEPRFEGASDAGLYGDVIQSLDHYVGVLLDALRERGLEEDTLVILTSDNGPWFEGSSGGLRGRKIYTYEGGLRVPCIARWPGVTPAGKVSELPVSVLDLLPTFCAYAGITPDPGVTLDGCDIRSVLEGADTAEHTPIYYFDDLGRTLDAVRDGRWKLHVRRHIENPDDPDRDQRELPELYDLERDPTESYNVSESHPAVVRRLRRLIEEFESDVKAELAKAG
ncbi:sulfatase [Streptomyces armeniacus]|uniref:Sulfatase n=2 Tax=Streptomyces armeniacus TaxID=83291 RepID=A0A345XY49_9ACTN|nr:sulfatase [Streptomyces armeniacus]